LAGCIIIWQIPGPSLPLMKRPHSENGNDETHHVSCMIVALDVRDGNGATLFNAVRHLMDDIDEASTSRLNTALCEGILCSIMAK
jgi:hypothetical protein